MPTPCCIICGIPFTKIHRAGGPKHRWDPSLDTETTIFIDRDRLQQGDILWLKDVVVVGTRPLDSVVEHGLPEFYSAEAVSDSFSTQYNQILIRDPTYTSADIEDVHAQFRSVSLYSEFVPMHEVCFEILDTVAERMGVPFAKDTPDVEMDGVTEEYVDYFFKHMDVDGAGGLRRFDYGLKEELLKALRENRFEDVKEFDFVFGDPLERNEFEDFLMYGPPVIREPNPDDSSYVSSPSRLSSESPPSSPSATEPEESEPSSSQPGSWKSASSTCNSHGHTSASPAPATTTRHSRQPTPSSQQPVGEDYLTHLPPELLLHITSYLPTLSILSLRLTSRRTHATLAFTEKIWRERCLNDFWFGGPHLEDLANMKDHTIDWQRLYQMLHTADFGDSIDTEGRLCWRNAVRVVRCAERIVEGVRRMMAEKEKEREKGKCQWSYYQKPLRMLQRIQAEAANVDGYESTTRPQLRDLIYSDLGTKVIEEIKTAMVPEISRVFRYASLLAPGDLKQPELKLQEQHLDIYNKQPPRVLTYYDNDGFLCGIRFWGHEGGNGVGVGRASGRPSVAQMAYGRAVRGFVVAFNAVAHRITDWIGQGLEVDRTGRKYGIIGLKVLFDDGECSAGMGGWEFGGVKQVLIRRTGLTVTGISVHVAEDGRIVSLGMLEADTIKHLRPGASTYPAEETGLDAKFWHPDLPPFTTLTMRNPRYTVEPEYDDSNFDERAHLMDYLLWNDHVGGYKDLKGVVFYGQELGDGEKTKQYVAGLGFKFKDSSEKRIEFKDMVCEKVLDTFELEEDEELVNFHFLFEEDEEKSNLSYSEMVIKRYIDIVFKTSKFRTSPFLSAGSPGKSFTAFDNPPHDFIHPCCIRGLAFDNTRNTMTPITQEMSLTSLPPSLLTKLQESTLDSTDNNPFRCAEGYTFCILPAHRQPIGEEIHNIIVSGFEGNLPGQYEGRAWLRTAMAAQTIFPLVKDTENKSDMEIVAVSYLEAQASVCANDPSYNSSQSPHSTSHSPKLVGHGLRLLAFHFADGSAPRILSNDIYERKLALESGRPSYSPHQLLRSAETIPIQQGRLKALRFRCVGVGENAYIDSLSITIDSAADSHGGEFAPNSQREPPREYQIYKYRESAEEGEDEEEEDRFDPNHLEGKNKKMRIVAEYRPIDLDDGREAGMYHQPSSPNDDLYEYNENRGSDEEFSDGDEGKVMRQEFVVECCEMYYEFTGLKALYPAADSQQIVALAAIYRCTGEGAPLMPTWKGGTSGVDEWESDESAWDRAPPPGYEEQGNWNAGGAMGGAGPTSSGASGEGGGSGGDVVDGDNEDEMDENGKGKGVATPEERSCLQELASRFPFAELKYGLSGPLFGGSAGESSTSGSTEKTQTEGTEGGRCSWW